MADAFEAARQAQQAAAQTAGSSQEKPKNLDEFINKLLDHVVNAAGKLTGAGKLNSLMNTGVLANVDITKAAPKINDPMLKGTPLAINSNLGSTILEGLQAGSIRDFSKIQVPDIASLGISAPEGGGSMSLASLGDLRPDPTPGVGMPRGAGMDMMA